MSETSSEFSRRQNIFFAGLLVVLSVIAYANALNHPFMMDDKALILSDSLQDHPLDILKHFVPSYAHGLKETCSGILNAAYFRPWAHALPLLEHVLFGPHPFYYHVFNVILLNIAAFLIYRFIIQLFNNRRLAFLTAVLFVIHPINGMLVNAITAGALSLMVIFSVGSLICAIKVYRGSRMDQAAFALGLLAYANAMLCHEVAMALPFFVAIALWYARPFAFKKFAGILLPYGMLMAGYFFFRMFHASLKTTIIDSALAMHLSSTDYLAAFAKLIVWYLKALLTLEDIVLIKSQAIDSFHAGVWLFIFVLMAAAIICVLKISRRPVMRFGLLFFTAGFLPAAAACFFQSNAGLILEPHWMLIASLGFFVIAADALDACYPLLRRKLWLTLVVVIIVTCIIAGWRYNCLWSDQAIYSRYWSSISPGLDRPWFFLGDVFVEKGQWPQARAAYLAGLQRTSRPFDYYYNLAGISLLEGKDLNQAKDWLLRALEACPSSSSARVNLGIVSSVLDGRMEILKERNPNDP